MKTTAAGRLERAVVDARAAVHRLVDRSGGEFDGAELVEVERGVAAFVAAVAVACQGRADREPTDGLLVADPVERECWRWFAARLAAGREGLPS